MMIFDEFYGGNSFTYKRVNYDFVGESFDENDNPNMTHRSMIKNFINR